MKQILGNAQDIMRRSDVISSLRYGDMRGVPSGRASKRDSMLAVLFLSAIFFAVTLF